MNHIYIFALVVNLIVGTAVFLFTRQIYKKNRLPFLKALLSYIIFFNLLVLAYFTSKYLYTNVVAGNILRGLVNQMIFLIRLILFIIAEAGIAYTLYRTVIILAEKDPAKWFKRVFTIGIVVFVILHGYGMGQIFSQAEYLPLSFVEMVWELLVSFFIVILMAVTSILSYRRNQNPNAVRSFALLFLAGYLVYLGPNLYFYSTGKGLGTYLDPFVLLLINLLPFLWLRFFYLKQELPYQDLQDLKSSLTQLYSKYDVTRREQEIIELILMGKSNLEISDKLYLSFHTIKNHVYNLFKKFDVKSRSQLIHKINQRLSQN